MLAVDTNVIVRLVTNDEPKQAKRAAQAFALGPVFIAKTVLLECEWVLSYSYGIERMGIERSFRGLLGLPNVTVEDADAVVRALEWYAAGFDFADALHLASSARARRFLTFDEKFAKRAAAVARPEVALA